MEKVQVFLTDWQVLFREGIHFTLSGEEDFEVVGEATNNEEALNFIEKNPPGVAIFNVDRGKPTGIEITRRIKQNLPSVSVILIMDSENEEQLFSALKCGASACLTKDVDPDELVSTIRKVVQGANPISEALLKPEIASRVIDEFETFSLIGEEVDNLLARPSSSEGDILRHIADGDSIEQITQAMGINEKTVRRHLDLVLTKLVANEHNRDVIEVAQSHLPPIVSRARSGKLAEEYVTKAEFAAFKQSITERLKSLFTGELS